VSASEPPSPVDAVEQAILDLWDMINDLSRARRRNMIAPAQAAE